MSIYEDLFTNVQTQLDSGAPDGDCLLKALCAIADEIRAQRLQAAEFFDLDMEAREEEERHRQEEEVTRQESIKRESKKIGEAIASMIPMMPRFEHPFPLAAHNAGQCPGCPHLSSDHNDEGVCQYGICECKQGVKR